MGREHVDLSGDDFTHGDLVEKGRKGVWIEPLLPGKHPVNVRVMKVELVPTTNIVLNWASRTEAHKYDEKLCPITVRSKCLSRSSRSNEAWSNCADSSRASKWETPRD